jgi:hypothetical protein
MFHFAGGMRICRLRTVANDKGTGFELREGTRETTVQPLLQVRDHGETLGNAQGCPAGLLNGHPSGCLSGTQ